MTLSTFFILWLSCIFGNLAALPYVLQLTNTPLTPSLFLLTCLQACIIWAVIVFLGLFCAAKANFKLIDIPLKQTFYAVLKPSLIVGILVSATLILFDTYVFTPPAVSTHASRFNGFLSSFYGAINEEVLLRLFLLSLFVWILQTCLPNYKRTHIVWCSIILASIIFGIGHLPALYKIAGFSCVGIARVLVLNGIAGLSFGYLYWQYGLVASMIAHFMADVILHSIIT